MSDLEERLAQKETLRRHARSLKPGDQVVLDPAGYWRRAEDGEEPDAEVTKVRLNSYGVATQVTVERPWLMVPGNVELTSGGPRAMFDMMSNDERVNAYDCPTCGRVTWTIDIDQGVTPFLLSCPDCGGLARSRFYLVAPDHPEPTHEWYRASDQEARAKEREHPGSYAHHQQGGLFLRAR